jgi:hypothetical protein
MPVLMRPMTSILFLALALGCGDPSGPDAVPVATIQLGSVPASLPQGSTVQLSVTLKDTADNVLSGRTTTWTTSNANVASVSTTGMLTAVAVGGPVTITATSESKSATLQVSVVPRTAARVAITPSFSTIDVGAEKTLAVAAYDALNVAITSPTTTWSMGSSAVATVSSGGVVKGLTQGVSLVAAKVDAMADTAAVAILGPTGIAASVLASNAYMADAKPGQTITVVVALDMTRPSATGDLGAAQFELTYDPALLTYVSAESNATGSSNFNTPTAGSFKYSFAGTAAQGSGNVKLVTVSFTVSTSATVGTIKPFTLSFTGSLTNTSFQNYSTPVVVAGRVRVAAP